MSWSSVRVLQGFFLRSCLPQLKCSTVIVSCDERVEQSARKQENQQEIDPPQTIAGYYECAHLIEDACTVLLMSDSAESYTL